MRSPKQKHVVFLWTDDNLTRGASPRLYISVHSESEGRQVSQAGLAQWLGTWLAGGRAEGPGSIPPSHGLLLCLKIIEKFGSGGQFGVGL